MIGETEWLRWRIARRYRWPWFIGYALGKLRFDPAYREVLQHLGGGSLPLLDIGCGMGLLAFYLRERGYTAAITGLDVDERKIHRGLRIAGRHYADVHLRVGDCVALPTFAGHVTMLDVLHYLDPEEQARVAREMAARVAPGGWCLIRTTPHDDSWRFRCTLANERLAQGVSWMSRDAVAFPRLEGISAQFDESEFTCDIRPLWGRTPFNSWLLAFRRRP